VLPAQNIPQLVPFSRTMDLLVVDSAVDGVWRLADRGQEGFFNEPGDVTAYYDDVQGSIALTNPTCIAVGPTGTAFVADSTEDIVLALADRNGDGDALSPGEHWVFFDSTNLSGIVMASAQGITVDAVGNVFVASSGTTGGGIDAIIRLTDLNNDGDANDLGEAIEYCQIPNASASVGDSIPTKVVVAPDGKLYYTDVGATAALIKGVYQLTDLNGDGDANDPGEHTLFWSPPAPSSAFYWGLAVDRSGYFYVTDHGNEQVWRARDANGNGVIDANEENLYYQTSASTWWDVIVHPDGRLFLCEDQTPDRVTVLEDLDGNGDALGAGEAYEAYDVTVAAVATVKPRGGAFMRAPILSVQPSTVPLGQSVALVVATPRPGDTVGLMLSDRMLAAPFPFAPFGEFEVNPQLLFPIVTGFSDAQGFYQFNLPIPNNPGLIGGFAFQAVAGNPFRFYLSNGAPLTIQ
jgi:hypothetical protein